jgi:hypothetical protein
MSHCDRLRYIAARGCLAVVFSLGLQQAAWALPIETDYPVDTQQITGNSVTPDQQTETPTAQDVADPDQTATDAGAVENQGQAEPTSGECCQTANQRENADLVAQQSMADSADTIVDLTWAQAFIAILGLSLLGYTLKLSRDATNAAVAAAKAADRQAEISADTAKRQLRAYLHVISVRIHPFDNAIISTVTIKNGGQTPAHNVVTYITMVSGKIPDFHDVDTINANFHLSKVLVGPDVSINAEANLAISGAVEWDLIVQKHREFFVWGKVTYNDIFGEIHYVNMRFMIPPGFANVNKLELTTCREGNDAD